jgi:hypothetical protein
MLFFRSNQWYQKERVCFVFLDTKVADSSLRNTTQERGMKVATIQTKSFNTPDEVRTLPKTKVEVITFGDLSLMKVTLEPGWRWSEHVKPTAKTSSCEVSHFNYAFLDFASQLRISTAASFYFNASSENSSPSHFHLWWSSNYFAADYDLGLPEGFQSPTASTDLVRLVKTCHQHRIRFFDDMVMAFATRSP